MAKAASPIPEGFSTVTPIVTMEDTRKAIDWYVKALGAEELPGTATHDGLVTHAELQIGKSRLMLHDPMMEQKGVRGYGGSAVGLWMFVEDCDAVFARAVDAGAKVKMPVGDQFWGDRCGTFTDPFGLSWSVATRKEDLSAKEIDKRQAEFFASQAAKVS
jgi:PhnB protein